MSEQTGAGLSDERLADIRRFVDFADYGRGDGRDDALMELIVEVERLERQRNTWLEIARVMATHTGVDIGEGQRQCAFCDHVALDWRRMVHADTCIVDWSRAALARVGREGAGDGE